MHACRKTLASRWSGALSRTMPGPRPSCASWTCRCADVGRASLHALAALMKAVKQPQCSCRWTWMASPGRWMLPASQSSRHEAAVPLCRAYWWYHNQCRAKGGRSRPCAGWDYLWMPYVWLFSEHAQDTGVQKLLRILQPSPEARLAEGTVEGEYCTQGWADWTDHPARTDCNMQRQCNCHLR